MEHQRNHGESNTQTDDRLIWHRGLIPQRAPSSGIVHTSLVGVVIDSDVCSPVAAASLAEVFSLVAAADESC